ncbi:hypothetical protein [Microvirus mar52]|uniref:Uncharacterized protein n=1 Tax=Microvirus mar52 TaxID=2851188 RepID=A0A8F5MJD2_9VIRU|nr:hypothetical protein [Microvirus mar52]
MIPKTWKALALDVVKYALGALAAFLTSIL